MQSTCVSNIVGERLPHGAVARLANLDRLLHPPPPIQPKHAYDRAGLSPLSPHHV